MSTATKAPQEFVTFRERVQGLSRKDLVQLAKDEFSLTVESGVNKDTISDILIREQEDRIAVALEKNQASSQLFLEANPQEQLLSVQFIPLDFPTNPLKFSYDGGMGIRNRKNLKKDTEGKLKGLSRMANFFLIPGQIYQLPICVINHLKSKTMHDAKPVFDTETGMQSGVIPVIKPRFSLVPQLSPKTMNDLGSRTFKKGS